MDGDNQQELPRRDGICLVSAYKAGDQAPADAFFAMLDAAMSTADARLAVIVHFLLTMEAALDREAIWTDTLKNCVGQ